MGSETSTVAYLRRLERFVDRIGRSVAWLALAMVAVQFLVVVLRYAFDLGWIGLQESVTYMHSALFMMAMAYTLQRDGHVRVDIFYRRMSRRRRSLVDLAGTMLLLFPVCIFIISSGWDYVADSWTQLEGSREAGGIPGVWLLKSLIILMPSLLLLQGAVLAVRSCLHLIATQGGGVQGLSAGGDKDGAG
jgi:TRAP-type mannitol/chloroaromatic compound transport system permease small subunit